MGCVWDGFLLIRGGWISAGERKETHEPPSVSISTGHGMSLVGEKAKAEWQTLAPQQY